MSSDDWRDILFIIMVFLMLLGIAGASYTYNAAGYRHGYCDAVGGIYVKTGVEVNDSTTYCITEVP